MKRAMLVIGGSAGSLEFLIRTLPLLWAGYQLAIVIVLHRKSGGDSTLTEVLASRSALVVKEVEEKESILPGVIYIAPPDYHVLIERDFTFSLDYSEKVNYSRPSIDITFESAADVYGDGLACLLLSGSNADGVAGMKVARERGGIIAVQDPARSEMPFMPQRALDEVKVDFIVDEQNILAFWERCDAIG